MVCSCQPEEDGDGAVEADEVGGLVTSLAKDTIKRC